ncbi:PREDICTED: solute carrier family 43 member 3-like [Leptosomus discolor]|uniref:solute carrier family 43 member 3-like n=1 Tax=Leptosomus discolor TaxID=188344 RepID=UPI0005227C8D|nr:PREDICTED: solute carrier family 43 member 3-like [Leptosomus discolor]
MVAFAQVATCTHVPLSPPLWVPAQYRGVSARAFCGIIFGWASLVFVLKDLDYFKDLCEPTACASPNQTLLCDCSRQDEQFSLVFTIGSFMNNFMTFPMGFIFDRFGTTVARLIAM